MASESDKHPETETSGSPSPASGDEKRVLGPDSIGDRSRAPRHPRWTREETFVLIRAKMVVEERVQRGHRPSFGSDQHEPKWDSVASYCKENGVNRESVQCRKRWSNLLGDFKKIKTWESRNKGEAESFWTMRGDLRKQHKLPGFFDPEVFDALAGKPITIVAVPLTMVLPLDSKSRNGVKAKSAEEKDDEEQQAEAVFDSQATEDGLISDSEQSGEEEAGWSPEKASTIPDSPATVTTPPPVSDKQAQTSNQENTDQDTPKEKHPSTKTCRNSISLERWKRRRLSTNGSEDRFNFGDELINVLQKNSNMLNAHFKAQNINCQLDRDQQKKQTDSIVTVLGKLTDALVRIADKL